MFVFECLFQGNNNFWIRGCQMPPTYFKVAIFVSPSYADDLCFKTPLDEGLKAALTADTSFQSKQ